MTCMKDRESYEKLCSIEQDLTFVAADAEFARRNVMFGTAQMETLGLTNADDEIMSGYSICRNPALAAVFYHLQLIEAYGTGILKMFESYKTSPNQPGIEVTPNVFKLVLPSQNVFY